MMKFKVPDTPEELFGIKKGGTGPDNRWIVLAVLAIFVTTFLLTSVYTVDQDEVGVVRQFGKYVRTTPPGLHFKLPFNMEKVNKVKITKVYKEEFGFRTLKAGVRTTYSSKSYDDESLMLSGDLNVVDVSWVIHFRIKNPKDVLFKIRYPLETVRDLSEATMRQVIGDHSFNEAVTTRKNEIGYEVEQRLQALLDSYESGIKIEKVELQEVLPPEVVKPAFNEVNEAEQQKEKMIYQSQEAYNKAIPRARGEAEKLIQESEGYALARVKKAEGDAAKFLETWNAYKEAKDVTRRRLYLETMQEAIPKAGKIYIFDPKANKVLPLLNITEGGE